MFELPERFYQNITDLNSILDYIRYAIDTRIVLKMEFPRTRYSWITYFWEILQSENGPVLLVDKVKGFEAALARVRYNDVAFEFRDKEKIPLFFRTRFTKSTPQGFIFEVPKDLQRIQRRQYFRIETPAGAEVTFAIFGEEENGIIANIGGGGTAFLIRREAPMIIGGLLKTVRLGIPKEKGHVRVEIPEAAIKRIELAEDKKILVALEFTEISEGIRKEIISYVFERQRSIIRKIGH